MVTITSLAKDERSARVALASALEPDDAVTGRLLAAVGAVETVRLAAGAGALPKNVDAVEARLWRNKVAPRMDARTVTQALAETDRLGLRILIPSDDEWPTALNDLGNRAPHRSMAARRCLLPHRAAERSRHDHRSPRRH